MSLSGTMFGGNKLVWYEKARDVKKRLNLKIALSEMSRSELQDFVYKNLERIKIREAGGGRI